ncbi:MAG: serine/threonine protein kinase, partial [Burkholderiales bacterium]
MAAEALKKLGKYEIRGTLGKGAMGIVYDGFDPMIERRVAIKTIAKDTMDPDEAVELLGRFKREAQAAGRLSHPGIVSIYDYGEEQGLAFIAMEYIKGKELRKYFESDQRFDLAQTVRIMCDVLDALDHAHRNGVVHRDIKPANIMITDEGRVKVADFGVARIESSMMTQVGTRIGTPAYMSPEQHQGLPVDGRSDVFSAGVMAYQFLTGERPFTGGGYTIIQQILKQDPIPPSEINFSIPRTLDLVVGKALAKRAEDRFATAGAFAEALRKAATGEQPLDLVLDAKAPPADIGNPARTPAEAPRKTTDTSGTASDISLEAELEFWREIKDSSELSDF